MAPVFLYQNRKLELKIAVDLMGSDHSPEQLLSGVETAAKILGKRASIISLSSRPLESSLCIVEVHPEEIGVDEAPLEAVKKKPQSTLICGLRKLQKKEVDAFVSVGNTGALVAGATLLLPKQPHVKRPALLATFPIRGKDVVILDVGGSAQCRPTHLIHFAQMGAIDYQRRFGTLPRVGLLNIGIESKKGTPTIQKAYQSLIESAEGMTFIGNIEARDIFENRVDVIVTDGFTGNIFLKTVEEMSQYLFNWLKPHLPEATQFQKAFDYAEYPGAILAGVEGIVIKCHGASTPTALTNGILGAYKKGQACVSA